jgi:hypothetical protein
MQVPILDGWERLPAVKRVAWYESTA